MSDKRKLTEEDIEFLTAMQIELNDSDSNTYYVIREFTRIYGTNLANADGVSIADADSLTIVCEVEYDYSDIESAINTIVESIADYSFYEEVIDEIKSAYDWNSLMSALHAIKSTDLIINEYQDIAREKGCFLTKKAAEKYLKTNKKHYSENACVVEKVIFHSKEDKLWDILKHVDFEL